MKKRICAEEMSKKNKKDFRFRDLKVLVVVGVSFNTAALLTMEANANLVDMALQQKFTS